LYFTANALFAAGIAFHAFLYNFYLEGLGLSSITMGRAAAALSLGGLLALLPAGWAVDRWGAKPAILVAAVSAALGLGWGAVVGDPVTIYSAAALVGVAGTSWRVAQAPVLMDLSTPSNRARLFAWDVALLIGGGAGATALAGQLVPLMERSWGLTHGAALTGAMLLGAGVTGASALLYATIGLPSAVTPGSADPKSSAPIPVPVILLIGGSGIWLAALVLAAPFFNIYFARTFHLPIERVGWIFSVTTIATALLVAAAGELATRVGPKKAFAGWLLLFAPAMWGLAVAPTVTFAAVCYLLQNLVSPAANPLLDQMLLEAVPVERRGVVSSWRQAMANAGQAASQFAGGSLLAGSSFPVLFASAGALGLVAGAGVALLAWRLIRFSPSTSTARV
jgi:MFS family permease